MGGQDKSAVASYNTERTSIGIRYRIDQGEPQAQEFRDLAELDRSLPSRDKRSVAVLLAARPWVFSMFESLRHPRTAALPGGEAREGPGRA